MTASETITNLGNAIINLANNKVSTHATSVESTLLDLKDTIDDIIEEGGGVIPTPTGTLSINQNGTYDVMNYASANVNVSGGSTPVISSLNVTPTTSAQTITAPSGTDGYSPINVSAVTSSIDSNITAGNIKNGVTILGVTGNYEGSSGDTNGMFRVVSNGSLKFPVTGDNFSYVLPSNITNIGYYGMAYAFYTGNSSFPSATGLREANLLSLTTVDGDHAFYRAFKGCSNFLGARLDNLVTVSGIAAFSDAFTNCTVHPGNQFYFLVNATGETAFWEAFRSCSMVNEVFRVLSNIDGSRVFYRAYRECTSLRNIYFYALTSTSFGSTYTNQFTQMLYGVSNCTVHFPSNLESVIGSWSDVTSGFGGTNTTVLFDLQATA